MEKYEQEENRLSEIQAEETEETVEVQDTIAEEEAVDKELFQLQCEREIFEEEKNKRNLQLKELTKKKKELLRRTRKGRRNKSIAYTTCIMYVLVLFCIWSGILSTEEDPYEAAVQEVETPMLEVKAEIDSLQNEIDSLYETRQKIEAEKERSEIKKEIEEIIYGGNREKPPVLNAENKDVVNTYIQSLLRRPNKAVEEKEYNGTVYYQACHKENLDEYTLIKPGNTVIFPGAVIRGDSLMNGSADYTLISVERTPITFSNDLLNSKSYTVEEATYAAAQDVLSEMQKDIEGQSAKAWSYKFHSIKNEMELQTSLGIGIDAFGANVSNTLTSSKTNIAVEFIETYYTVNAEPLVQAADYFRIGTDLSCLEEYEPAYVSSVDYGRRVIVLVSSDIKSNELEAGLSAVIKGVSIDAAISSVMSYEDCRCSIYNYGGESIIPHSDEKEGGIKNWWGELWNGKDKAVDGINQMIADSKPLSNPVPISYTLKYLSDNSVVPAAKVTNEMVILAADAQRVTFRLSDVSLGTGEKETFELDKSAEKAGVILSDNSIIEKGDSIIYLWDSSKENVLEGKLNGEIIDINMVDEAIIKNSWTELFF